MKMDSLNRCVNCGRMSTNEEIRPVKDLATRITPGQVLPSGECPQCDNLTYPIYLPNADWLTRLGTANQKMLNGMRELKELLTEIDAPVEAFALGGLLTRSHEMFVENVKNALHLVAVVPELTGTPDELYEMIQKELGATDDTEEEIDFSSIVPLDIEGEEKKN